MKQKGQYLSPDLRLVMLSQEDMLTVSGGDRDPFDVDNFDPLGSGAFGD